MTVMQAVGKNKLGQILCQMQLLNEEKLQEALQEQARRKSRLGKVLVDMEILSPVQLNQALCKQAGIESVNVEQETVNKDAISMVPAELVCKYHLLPLSRENGKLRVAMVDPFQTQALEELRVVSGLSIQRCLGRAQEMERAIQRYYGSNVARMVENLAGSDSSKDDPSSEQEDFSPAKLHELAREPSLVNLVNLILLEAIEARASDVHIEPFEKHVSIKYRIDGILVEKSPSPKRLQAAIISRIKIMADMNIAERFVPQDGHIEFVGNQGKVDIRVSTVPTVFGESITMRILDRSAALISLDKLGMDSTVLDYYSTCLSKPHGIVLVTGPTGSGKTTTLYASLNKIFTPSLKIITIEDPVEYQLEGVIQMPVNPRRGLTFARGLRHILRQDPDIIMVGEIRDRETADIAIRAALTGHLVFSTLHTNDAPGAVSRLIDMGVEPFLLASSLEAVLAQRLVRRICPACKKSYKPDPALLKSLGNGKNQLDPESMFYKGQGCPECMNTGTQGRSGIFELLRITEPLRQLISTNPTTEEIRKAAPPDHNSMIRDGVRKILAGDVSPEEVLRVTQSIED